MIATTTGTTGTRGRYWYSDDATDSVCLVVDDTTLIVMADIERFELNLVDELIYRSRHTPPKMKAQYGEMNHCIIPKKIRGASGA